MCVCVFLYVKVYVCVFLRFMFFELTSSVGGQSLEFGRFCSRSLMPLRQPESFQGSAVAAGPRLDEAMSRTACVTLGEHQVAPEMRLRTSQFILDVPRVGGGCGQAPWDEGLLHSWAQTFTPECRALCKHGNGVAQHLLEARG